ncbi:hypothetical protein [uncultured Arthrobacter sp.]|uniref:hypothetical protein n=1 Tax=uncultured Arthrobacter sp. TaxID=114050 RepID=UPI0026166DD4|nr:hypothetical protein [uncultured Arthrobacter sp.]
MRLEDDYMGAYRARFEQFGIPLLSLSSADRFVLNRVNWEGTSEDPTDIAEVSYIDTRRKDLKVRTSIRTYHAGHVTRSRVDNQTSLNNHLVTAFSQQLVPAKGFGPGFRTVLEDFERRTAGIKLRDSTLLIDDEKVVCRAGSFDFMSVAEVVIKDRVATLIGPDGFLEEPLSSAVLPEY